MPPVHIPVEIKVLDERLRHWGLPAPATPGAAAADVRALAIFPRRPDGKPDLGLRRPLTEALHIVPGEVVYIGLGFALSIGDPGYAAHMLPRSSAAALGLAMANTVGLLDSDYHGEYICAVFNRNPTDGRAGMLTIEPGDRIAQMYLAPVVFPDYTEVTDFTEDTTRGAGGFGSTGT